eukprot:437363-Prymnesium_polylepis.1
MHVCSRWEALIALAFTAAPGFSIHNAVYYDHPPMGWRSYNCFDENVDQQKMLSIVDAVVKQRAGLDGELTSFLQLGFSNVGLDDGWQECWAGEMGSFHDGLGRPIVDLDRFPNMSNMTAYGHARGIRMGFYLKCVARVRITRRLKLQHVLTVIAVALLTATVAVLKSARLDRTTPTMSRHTTCRMCGRSSSMALTASSLTPAGGTWTPPSMPSC